MTAQKKVRNLPVELSPEEHDQRSRRLAECVQKKAEVQAERQKAVALAYREVKELDGEIKTLSEIVSTGREIREVEVHERKDIARSLLETVRADTHEVVDSRQLTIEEKQGDLPFERQQHEHGASYISKPPEEAPASPKLGGKGRGRPRLANVPAPEEAPLEPPIESE